MTDKEIFETEIKCIKRRSSGQCNGGTDCGNCDLLMNEKDIIFAYERAIKANEIINRQHSEKEEMTAHIKCLKKECDEWHKAAELEAEKAGKLRASLEKRGSQCDEFEKLVKKALTLCDDKDAQMDRLFEVVEEWKKAYEGARRLACEEIKLIPGFITRKKIDKLLREKGW